MPKQPFPNRDRVLLLHGIGWQRGPWFAAVRPALDGLFLVEEGKYPGFRLGIPAILVNSRWLLAGCIGLFVVLLFGIMSGGSHLLILPSVLLPVALVIGWWRRAKAYVRAMFHVKLLSAKHVSADSELDAEEIAASLTHVAAHSFGTWLLGHSTRKEPARYFGSVVFVASPLPPTFDWRPALRDTDREIPQIQSLRNEVCPDDGVVALARMLPGDRRHFGSAGTDGFVAGDGVPVHNCNHSQSCLQCAVKAGSFAAPRPIHNVRFEWESHSTLLTEPHAREHWVPHLLGLSNLDFNRLTNVSREAVRAKTKAENGDWWVRPENARLLARVRNVAFSSLGGGVSLYEHVSRTVAATKRGSQLMALPEADATILRVTTRWLCLFSVAYRNWSQKRSTDPRQVARLNPTLSLQDALRILPK